MKLGANTFVYEVGNIPIQRALESIAKIGFTFVDLAAYGSADPRSLSRETRKMLVKQFRDLGLVSSQLLLVNTQDIASCDLSRRNEVMEYMKRAAELQLELGGKQVLICWGCGVYQMGIPKEETWIHSVRTIQEFARWCQSHHLIVDLEMDPHVYFVVNNMEKMAKILEDINEPNVYPNVDIGHMWLTRESPITLLKFRDRVIHIHLSETEGFEHTNSIIGTGQVDFVSYIRQIEAQGAHETCEKLNETLVAGIEMGKPGGEVDDPERWMQGALRYLKEILPNCTL